MDKMGLGELLPSVPQAQVDESCKIRGSRPTDGLALVYSGTGDCGQARLRVIEKGGVYTRKEQMSQGSSPEAPLQMTAETKPTGEREPVGSLGSHAG